jgi:hypothetical protein
VVVRGYCCKWFVTMMGLCFHFLFLFLFFSWLCASVMSLDILLVQRLGVIGIFEILIYSLYQQKKILLDLCAAMRSGLACTMSRTAQPESLRAASACLLPPHTVDHDGVKTSQGWRRSPRRARRRPRPQMDGNGAVVPPGGRWRQTPSKQRTCVQIGLN